MSPAESSNESLATPRTPSNHSGTVQWPSDNLMCKIRGQGTPRAPPTRTQSDPFARVSGDFLRSTRTATRCLQVQRLLYAPSNPPQGSGKCFSAVPAGYVGGKLRSQRENAILTLTYFSPSPALTLMLSREAVHGPNWTPQHPPIPLGNSSRAVRCTARCPASTAHASKWVLHGETAEFLVVFTTNEWRFSPIDSMKAGAIERSC